ncbi:unnamed protein product [Gongylonema pulchrum]|uniref:Uncharacterized protein n=1 Tax=Gongylonema pulchrum TaxID=637853 RepID=A0A183EW76_9BILA|nr:unnamed protein product [Gongylonema pulchrum]
MSRRIATLYSSDRKSRSRSGSRSPSDGEDEQRQQGFFVGGSESRCVFTSSSQHRIRPRARSRTR